MDLEEEINKLQKEKQECLQAITAIKHKVSELDCQKNEALNEVNLYLYYRTKLLPSKLFIIFYTSVTLLLSPYFNFSFNFEMSVFNVYLMSNSYKTLVFFFLSFFHLVGHVLFIQNIDFCCLIFKACKI